ncbi:hypothetical protein [Pseudothioclava arenosa]|uniref:hypothetical protein n=1 Tax=Pseudothioclava arenosa TaxID=1795308 RepID=UPI0015CD74B7|nr:hypothetical protein [Pseudothioclava arenosa]
MSHEDGTHCLADPAPRRRASGIRAEAEAGSLDRIDMLGESGDGGVLRCLRRWEEEGLC